METKSLIIGLMLINVMLGTFGQVLLKSGINVVHKLGPLSLPNFFLQSFLSPLVLGGLILYLISLFLWLIVLSKADLSFAYPLISISYILVIIFSGVFLHEVIGPARVIGALLIIAGVFFITRS